MIKCSILMGSKNFHGFVSTGGHRRKFRTFGHRGRLIGLQLGPIAMSLIQERRNTISRDPSCEFQVGLIRGPRKASPWIEGPTNTRLSGQLTGTHAEPTLAQHLRRTRGRRCLMAHIPGRPASLHYLSTPSFSCMLSIRFHGSFSQQAILHRP
jgi:hypothetical protein